MANIVNATFGYSYLTPLVFGMLMRQLPSLPYIYSSVFTYLRHICKEKICANLFFRPVSISLDFD